MSAAELTLATLGLTAVEESLVKSLLHVLDGRTSAVWRHVDGFDADVVICAPANQLSLLARKHEQEAGSPMCIALVNHDERAKGWSRSVHRPLRMHEFLDALEAVSSETQASPGVAGSPNQNAVPMGAPRQQPYRNSLVSKLRNMHASTSTNVEVILVSTGPQELAVALPQGRCHAKNGFTPETFAALMSVRGNVETCAMAAGAHRERLLSEPWIWLDTLLWRLGLLGRGEVDLGVDSGPVTYRLRSWPDFGKIPSNPMHIKLTALLSKRELDIDSAAKLVNSQPEEVRAFLRAAACCGLLEIVQVPQVAVLKPALQKARFGVFDFLRSALGMRA